MFNKDGVPGAKTGEWVDGGDTPFVGAQVEYASLTRNIFSLLLDDQQHLRIRGGVRPRALPLVRRPARGAARRGCSLQHALRRPLLGGN